MNTDTIMTTPDELQLTSALKWQRVYGQAGADLIRQVVSDPTLIDNPSIDWPPQSVEVNEGVVTGFFLNQVANPSHFFRAVFELLPANGYLIFPVELIRQRKARLLRSYPKGINHGIYIADFVLHRVLPRLKPTKWLYHQLFLKKAKAISKAEVFGRLYHAGFRIEQAVTDGKQYTIVARKMAAVYPNNPPSSEGPIFRMARVGKAGQRFSVYKLRTMHPYSEYLQQYLIETNGLEAGGKFKDDFRISTLGHFARKYWIDELPMLINLLKGDMKLVGIRPISQHYFSLYPDELQRERIKSKPGLLPPYYADMPKSFDEIVQSELRYLRAYQQNPLLTDLRYFFRILSNILLKSARSK
jgi:lipopolysaccharide/colanic/teichoic acid biosynthesis glycosyltransferase